MTCGGGGNGNWAGTTWLLEGRVDEVYIWPHFDDIVIFLSCAMKYTMDTKYGAFCILCGHTMLCYSDIRKVMEATDG